MILFVVSLFGLCWISRWNMLRCVVWVSVVKVLMVDLVFIYLV